MLVYVVTIAISAFFVPHYLWRSSGEPLRTNPWDIVVGAVVIVVLVALNIVGVTEAAKLSIVLAVRRLRDAGAARARSGSPSSSAPRCSSTTSTGASRRRGANLAIAIPVAMLAYTGVETVSNLAEEAREPGAERARTRTSSSRVAVFAIYFTLPLIALSALPVKEIDGELTTLLALPPEQGGYANDPILGVVDNLGLEGVAPRLRRRSTSASSPRRSSSSPRTPGSSAPRGSRTRWRRTGSCRRSSGGSIRGSRRRSSRSSLFAGIAPIVDPPARATSSFVGTLYSLGATLSFTVAHASMVRLRTRPDPAVELPRAPEPAARAASTGRCSRSSAGSRPASRSS